MAFQPGRVAARQQIAIRKGADVLSGATAERHDLLSSLALAHEQVITLLGLLVRKDNSFVPSETELWPEIVRRNEILRRYGIEPK